MSLFYTLTNNIKILEKENFTSVSRYLARGNRIKTVKLRGTISDGLVISPEKFESLLDKKTKRIV